jgi:hypothetical protein
MTTKRTLTGMSEEYYADVHSAIAGHVSLKVVPGAA